MPHSQNSRLSPAILFGLFLFISNGLTFSAIAQVATNPDQEIQPENLPSQTKEPETQLPLDIPEQIIEESPTLQKWIPETPNILQEIKNDPSFRTRLNLGFSLISADEDLGSIKIGIEDIFIKRTGLTISSGFQTSFNGEFINTGAELNYFLFPLGGFINLAPLIGYRFIQQDDFNTGGVNLGLRLAIALSRTEAANINIAQSFINPQGSQEIGLFSISVGYAIASKIRLASEWKRINSPQDQSNIFTIGIQKLF